MRVHEFFRDYDKLRSGLISKAKFRNGLEACKFFALNEVGRGRRRCALFIAGL